MILIFTAENELSSMEVAKWLNHYNQKVHLINPDEDVYKFFKINNKGIYFENKMTNEKVNLLDATSCWWRRTGLGINNFIDKKNHPSEFVVDGMDLSKLISGMESVLSSEFVDLKKYIFDKVYHNCKINIGSPKLYGLNRLATIDLAKKHGLKVPDYEVITNMSQINSSDTITQKFVTKTIANGIYHQIENKSYYSYTELQNKEDFVNEDIPVFPSLIMSLVEKKYEIRTFYLDGHFYSMAIFSQSNKQTTVDFRKYSEEKPNRNEPFKLPRAIEEKLDAIFKEIGLNCGSVDLILDTNDEFVFLEINPVGQYGMTSEPCNYNLDKKIAKYLINGRITE